MLNIKTKILTEIRKSKNQKTAILSAAIASLVASGSTPTDGGGGGSNGGGSTGGGGSGATNKAPTFADTGVLKLDLVENVAHSTTLPATDAEGDAITYSLSGADAALFSLNTSTGKIEFKNAPDFENKLDDDGDNVYEISIKATDSEGNSVSRDAELSIVNENEAPTFASDDLLTIDMTENATAVTTLAATDVDAGDGLTYTLSGDDAALFSVDSSGKISFINEPDFEDAKDADKDNSYEITLTATDEAGLSDSRDVKINVTDDESEPFVFVSNVYHKTAAEFLVNTTALSHQQEPDVALLSDGKFVIVWHDSELIQIKGQMYNADGSTFGNEFIASVSASEYAYQAAVTSLENGGFVVTWGNAQIHGQIYDNTGGLVGSVLQFSTQSSGSISYPQITGLTGGGFVATWTADYVPGDPGEGAIAAQIFTDTGVKISPVGVATDEFLVNSVTTGEQEDPQITALTNGGFVISWTHEDGASGDGDDRSIQSQIYASDGTPHVVGQIQVNSTIAGDQSLSSIAALADGGYVVVWQHDESALIDGGDGSNFAIRARVFSADGVPVAGDFLVNSQTEDTQSKPEILALNDGGFLVTWETDDSAQDGDDSAIKGQAFDHNYQPSGEEFLINSEHTSHQRNPKISTFGEHGFIVTWETTDTDQDGNGSAIKAQIFDLVEIHKYDVGSTHKFKANGLLLHEDQAGESITSFTISDIPDGMTFSQGTTLDGELTVSAAQMENLSFTLSGLNGIFDLAVTALASDGKSTTIKVPFSVGNVVNDAPNNGAEFTLTSALLETDHVDGLNGSDGVLQAGSIDDYTFKIIGDDIQMSDNNNVNVDLLHSIEYIRFTDDIGTEKNIDDFVNDGQISDISNSDYAYWLEHNYQYEIA